MESQFHSIPKRGRWGERLLLIGRYITTFQSFICFGGNMFGRDNKQKSLQIFFFKASEQHLGQDWILTQMNEQDWFKAVLYLQVFTCWICDN